MLRHLHWLTVVTVATITATAAGQVNPGPPDHGMVCATALEALPGGLKDTTNPDDAKNYVYRGQVITLDRDRTVHLVFDTEFLRVAGAWVGKPISSVSTKSMGPAINGTMVFSTRPGPGWTFTKKWDDPRTSAEGPLPTNRGRYDGLYLHGDRVVLSYRVGDIEVLESPTASGPADAPIVERTFNLTAGYQPRDLLVFEIPGGVGRLVKNAAVSNDTLDGTFAVVESPTERLSVGIRGAPNGASWEFVGGRVHLKLPRFPARFRIAIARLAPEQNSAALAEALKAEPADLRPFTKGGPARWTRTIETKGSVSADEKSAYVHDTFELPEKNPWRASIRFGGLDFFDDGRAALCTWDGDVWIVSGIDAGLKSVRWKRFAAGLHQPLGLKIVKGVIHVAGRDQVTRLYDFNDDGEADYYQNYNNAAGLTLQRHEFVMDLQTDSAGAFYYCRSGHYVKSKRNENCCVMRLSNNGLQLEVIARGLREPNGLSIGPDGTMTVADNEGNGIPQTPIYRLLPGRDYGFAPPATYQVKEKPIVWLPSTVDRSAGGQVWAPKNWGPLGGQLLHTSYGSAALFSVLIDKNADAWQGAVWRFPMNFTSGVMRARFSPTDGQLYVCGLRGWDTNGTRDGDFSRVRFTGAKSPMPVGIEVFKNAIAVEFSDQLDIKSAQDDQNWACEWNTGPVVKKASLKEMPIERIRLAADGRTVTLELEESEQMRPAPNYSLRYRIRASDGSLVTGALHGTIHGSR